MKITKRNLARLVTEARRLNETSDGSEYRYWLKSKVWDLDTLKELPGQMANKARETLPEYSAWDLYDDENIPDDLVTNFTGRQPLPGMFIISGQNLDILVDTQGYDYARYAAKIGPGSLTDEDVADSDEYLQGREDAQYGEPADIYAGPKYQMGYDSYEGK